MIYGIRSSGNQAEYGLRKTAELSKEQYSRVDDIIQKDVYVDDCISGEQSIELAHTRADELLVVLSRGGFTLKGFTFSWQHPDKHLSVDGNSINVAGMKWHSYDDLLQLDVSELNFMKKQRGKKPAVIEKSKKIPEKLTRRQCVSKVSELFDITGKITPITACMKLDLHTLVKRKLQWDDVIPEDLKPIWHSHFEMIE